MGGGGGIKTLIWVFAIIQHIPLLILTIFPYFLLLLSRGLVLPMDVSGCDVDSADYHPLQVRCVQCLMLRCCGNCGASKARTCVCGSVSSTSCNKLCNVKLKYGVSSISSVGFSTYLRIPSLMAQIVACIVMNDASATVNISWSKRNTKQKSYSTTKSQN